jgi:hypothetical protein
MLELIDAFTNDLIRDPVLATDGHVYDRSSLLKYFAARKSEGRPIVSPQDPEQPMREDLGEAPADVVAALAQLRADGELLKARQARSVTFKSLEALKVVFDVLDPLSELLAATLEGWKTPVVIVFGQETSGKSSLLERLAMMPLLPRGEDTCTRLPILLKLRHTKEAQLPVLVVRDSATGKEEVRRTVSLAGGQVDVRHEMERVLAAEHGGLTSVSMTRTIEVHVSGTDRDGDRLGALRAAGDLDHGRGLARDLEFFVKYLGMTPMEAIRSATVYGGQIMMRGHELGAVKDGYLADLLLVDGDPLQDLKLLQDKNRIPCVMKGGMFHRRAL